jgi:hypothetical protein
MAIARPFISVKMTNKQLAGCLSDAPALASCMPPANQLISWLV